MRLLVGDAQPYAVLVRLPDHAPGEVAAGLGIEDGELRLRGVEKAQQLAHEQGERGARRPAPANGGHQLEHEAELAARLPLVLAEVADQVAEGQQVEGPEEVRACEVEERRIDGAARG